MLIYAYVKAKANVGINIGTLISDQNKVVSISDDFLYGVHTRLQ